MSERQNSSAFDRMLDAAASAAPSVALELEAKGLRWTPEVVATVIACVLARTRSDLKKLEEWTSLLLPYVEKHLSEPPE
jgi:hypothetical protein